MGTGPELAGISSVAVEWRQARPRWRHGSGGWQMVYGLRWLSKNGRQIRTWQTIPWLALRHRQIVYGCQSSYGGKDHGAGTTSLAAELICRYGGCSTMAGRGGQPVGVLGLYTLT